MTTLKFACRESQVNSELQLVFYSKQNEIVKLF